MNKKIRRERHQLRLKSDFYIFMASTKRMKLFDIEIKWSATKAESRTISRIFH